MKKFLIILFLFSITSLFAESNHEKVTEALKNSKYEEAKAILTKWEKSEPENPDLLTGWFNYYQLRNHTSASRIGPSKLTGHGMYTYGVTIYDEKDLKTAIKYLDKAISLYPYRMDIQFGKARCLLDAEHYTEGTDQLITVLKLYEKDPSHDWYWTLDASFKENGWIVKDTFLECYQDYINMMDFGADRPKTQEFFECLLKVLGEDPVFLNYYSVFYKYVNDNENVLKCLLKAYELDKNDFIIMTNICFAYHDSKNEKEADKWYQKILNFHTDESDWYAEKCREYMKQ